MRTLGATGSHINSLEISTCSVESVDEEVCSARTTSRVSINRCWMFSLRREF